MSNAESRTRTGGRPGEADPAGLDPGGREDYKSVTEGNRGAPQKIETQAYDTQGKP